jgi:two-component system, NtrC family, response regulator HydG
VRKILVVDDDIAILDLMKRILERDRYQVLVASTGEQCLEIIDNNPDKGIEMIFLDLKMPGMGGENALVKIHERKPSIPVVVISGYGTFEDKLRLFKKEVRRFVTKPFNVDFIRTLAKNTLPQ